MWPKMMLANTFSFFTLSWRMKNNDLSIMNEDLANKDMGDMVISDKSFKDIIENDLRIPSHTKVEVIEVSNDEKVKFEVKNMWRNYKWT